MPQFFLIPLVALPSPQEPKTATGGPAERSTTGAPGAPGAAGAQTPAGGSGTPAGSCLTPETLMFMPLMLLIMWFMIIRPEQKRKKETATLMASLKAGDEVVTIGGMHGEVLSLTDREVVLRVDTVRMTFDRSAVARVVRDEPVKPGTKKA